MSFPKSQYLTSASFVNGKIYTVRNNVTNLLNLNHSNKILQSKNNELRKKEAKSFYLIDRTTFKINDTLFQQQFDYIPATVIQSTFDKRNNFFTLDVGRMQGIKRGMGVFSDLGIVGIIHFTSDHFSVVKSVLTENINIDVLVEKNGAFGLLKWNGKNARHVTISGISNDIPLKKWLKVVTRGGAGIFPKGIPIGKISQIRGIEGKPLWDVDVLLSENLKTTQYVYVIKNLLKNELDSLTNKIPQDIEDDNINP